MKYRFIILITCILIHKVCGQPSLRSTELLPSVTLRQTSPEANYDTISVGYTTSVNLIFDSPVKQWDMGLGVRVEGGKQVWDVLVENAMESPNRIKLAAGIQNFKTTNLFVETTRAYYNFMLRYDDRPKTLLYKVSIEQAEILKEIRTQESEFRRNILETAHSNPQEINKETNDELDSLEYFSQIVLEREDEFNPIGKSSQQILFFLSGIYIHEGHLFFKLYIQNGSNIPFDIGFIGFFKSDRGNRGNKKRPRQEELLTPQFVLNENIKSLDSNSELLMVYAFEKFTLSKHKRLYIQLWEGNQGERKIELVIKGRNLLRAVKLENGKIPPPTPPN